MGCFWALLSELKVSTIANIGRSLVIIGIFVDIFHNNGDSSSISTLTFTILIK